MHTLQNTGEDYIYFIVYYETCKIVLVDSRLWIKEQE